jgi:hypothetical protein
MASHMNRDLSYAILQASAARLYHSVGFDAVPREDEGKAVAELAQLVEARFEELDRATFSRPPAAQETRVAIGEIRGVPARAATMLRAGAALVLELSKARVVEAASAEVRLEFDAVLEAPMEGRRVARVAVRLFRAGGGAAAAGEAEFKTTMSEPVDDAQWRAVGEGAAYRILDRLTPMRARHSSLRLAQSLETETAPQPAAQAGDAPWLEGSPLTLRTEHVLQPLAEGRAGPGVQK